MQLMHAYPDRISIAVCHLTFIALDLEVHLGVTHVRDFSLCVIYSVYSSSMVVVLSVCLLATPIAVQVALTAEYHIANHVTPYSVTVYCHRIKPASTHNCMCANCMLEFLTTLLFFNGH